MNIKPDEAMIVNENDRRDAAYSLVKGRVYVPLVDMDELVKPSFIFLKSNDNPALSAFADFLAEARETPDSTGW